MSRKQPEDALPQIVEEVRRLLGQYGFGAFESRERVEGYLQRQFPKAVEAVAACTAVLYLPRYLDCLLWLQADPQTRALGMQYWAYFDSLIAGTEKNAAMMRAANRLFLLG